MISKIEKKKIIELIKQGYSNYKIGKMINRSPNTIKPIREELIKNGEYPVHKNEVNSDSALDSLSNLINGIEKIINTHQLKEKRKKELEKLLENLKKIICSEVDERIPKEREDAVKIRDQYWNKIIEEQYVKKEVVVNLEDKIKENNKRIELLSNGIKKKDDINNKQQSEYLQNLSFKQNKIESFIDQNRYLNNENLNIMKENIYLNNYIYNYLEEYERLHQNELNSQKKIFNKQQIDFLSYQKDVLKSFNDLSLKINEGDKGILICEDELANLKKRINICIEHINTEIELLNKIRENQGIGI